MLAEFIGHFITFIIRSLEQKPQHANQKVLTKAVILLGSTTSSRAKEKPLQELTPGGGHIAPLSARLSAFLNRECAIHQISAFTIGKTLGYYQNGYDNKGNFKLAENR